MNDADLQHFSKLINERERALQSQLDSVQESGSVVELDQTRQGRLSRMDALQQQAMAKASAGRLKAELREIRAARARLANDDYGYCASCDEKIARKRLEFNPAVRLCIQCAEAR